MKRFILSLDPGSKPGLAVLDTASLHERALTALSRFDLPEVLSGFAVIEQAWMWGMEGFDFVVESQWYHQKAGRAGVRALLQLARTAGAQAERISGDARCVHWIEPRVWRARLGLGALPKDIAYIRVADSLTGEERIKIPNASQDVIAAIAIGWVWYRFNQRRARRA